MAINGHGNWGSSDVWESQSGPCNVQIDPDDVLERLEGPKQLINSHSSVEKGRSPIENLGGSGKIPDLGSAGA